MIKKVYPIMVSTFEALVGALESNWCAIYIERCVFQAEEAKINRLMQMSGYRQFDTNCRRGVLFINTELQAGQIHDPMGIL